MCVTPPSPKKIENRKRKSKNNLGEKAKRTEVRESHILGNNMHPWQARLVINREMKPSGLIKDLAELQFDRAPPDKLSLIKSVHCKPHLHKSHFHGDQLHLLGYEHGALNILGHNSAIKCILGLCVAACHSQRWLL